VNKYVFNDSGSPHEESLASLFGYIAMRDKDRFYKTGTERYTHQSDLQLAEADGREPELVTAGK
jgi:hypothetical protein